MDIVCKSQGDIYSVPLCEGSIVHRELMGDHYIQLVFNTAAPVHFRLGDYCDTDFGRFELTSLYDPEYDAETGAYKYNLRLDAQYVKWKNKIIKYRPSSQQSEMSFSLTRTIAGHMELFISNLNALAEAEGNESLLYNGTTQWSYSIDVTQLDATTMKLVQYDGISFIEALTRYAEQWQCEWWVENNIIHLGRCEGGNTQVTFELNKNVFEMSRSDGSKQYITRLYVFGSERNIPANYRQNEDAVVQNGVVQRRLMLPSGTPYLGDGSADAVEGILILDDVYPKTACKVGGVNTYTSTAQNDGTTTTETFYRVSDSSGFRNKLTEEMKLDQLHIVFTSGVLNGMDFLCNLVENDKKLGKCFEIIASEDYGIKLPSPNYCPSVNDEYIIYGWDSTKIGDTELIETAEQKLVTEGNKYLAKSQVDPSEYTCTMISKAMQDAGMSVNGNDGISIMYNLGTRVNLKNPAILNGSRSSRVIGYEIKLDIPADSPQFIVGESLRYSRTGSLENKLDSLTFDGNTYSNGGGIGGGSSIYIITTGDVTPPSDRNVYSAQRSDAQYARKDRNDIIRSLWTFPNGQGARRGLQTEDYVGGGNEDNIFGKGFELVSTTNQFGNTRTRLEVDELLVRIKAFFANLEIREISYVGGNYVFSAAGSKIYCVEWLDANGNVINQNTGDIRTVYAFRCYLFSDDGTTATINKWALGDQVMCRVFNIDTGVHQNVSNKYYWRRLPLATQESNVFGIGKSIIKTRALAALERQYLLDVAAVNANIPQDEDETTAQQAELAALRTAYEAAQATINGGNVPQGATDVEAFTEYQYIDILMADCDTGSDYPEEGDSIVQFGNRTDERRQGVIHLIVEGNDAPAILEYSGINSYVLPSPTLQLSPKKNVIYGEFHSVVDSESGNTGSGDSIADQLRALLDRLNDIQSQADKKMEIWYGAYAPLPSIAFNAVEDTTGKTPSEENWYEMTNNAEGDIYTLSTDSEPVSGKTYYVKAENALTANYPASQWNTDDLKALHVQDLFYDTNREPASDGGRAYRWEVMYIDGVLTYRWKESHDQDTIAALDKISDVATDGKLTGGAEKTRVLVDWQKCVQDYLKYTEQARDYGMNANGYFGQGENVYEKYIEAYEALALMLNGGATLTDAILDGRTKPAWLADLYSTTVIPSPETYRTTWYNYYYYLSLLLDAIQEAMRRKTEEAQADATQALAEIGNMADDATIDPAEKRKVKREFLSIYHEMVDTDEDGYAAGILDMSMNGSGGYIVSYDDFIEPYILAFRKIGRFLNRNVAWTEPALANYDDTLFNSVDEFIEFYLPEWIKEDETDEHGNVTTKHIGRTETNIDGIAWRNLWAEFYATRSAVLTALSEAAHDAADHAQDTADEAHDKIRDIVSDGIISKGSEKSQLRVKWLETVAEYLKQVERAADYDLDDDEDTVTGGVTIYTPLHSYQRAYRALAKMLNGGVEGANFNKILTNEDNTLPSWLADIENDTILSETISTANPAETYRQTWNTYYITLTTLLEAITQKARDLTDAAQTAADAANDKIADISSDGWLTADEKIDVRNDFVAVYHEMTDEGGILDKATSDRGKYDYISQSGIIDPYVNAFNAIGVFLNNNQSWANPAKNANNKWAKVTPLVLPIWIQDDETDNQGNVTTEHISAKNAIDGNTFCNLWATFYARRTAVLTALSGNAQTTATNAHERVDDIVSDGIISAGSEKSKLLLEWLDAVSAYANYTAQAVDHLEWLGTTGEEGTLRTALGTAKDTFVAKVKALGTFLNGGTSWDYAYNAATKPLPLYLGTDATDGFEHDTNLTAHSQTAAGYRTCWSQYYDAHISLLRYLTRAGKLKTEKAQADATTALNLIDGIAADGVLSVTEIPDLKREFETAYRQREEMVDLATDDTTHKLIDASLRTPLDTYLAAFTALADYLNMNGHDGNGTWDEPSDDTSHAYYYTVNNGALVADGSATYLVKAKVPLANADFPAMMGITQDLDFVANWSANPLVTDGGAKFRDLWADLERQRVALANAMATLAKDTADGAQTTANGLIAKMAAIASDSVIEECEIADLKQEFLSALHEMWDVGGIMDRSKTVRGVFLTTELQTLCGQLDTAIQVIGTYLNVDPSSPTSNHDWRYITSDENRQVTIDGETVTIQIAQLDWDDTLGANIPYLFDDSFVYTSPITIVDEDGNPDAEGFINAWASYYSIRSSVLAAISKAAHDAADMANDAIAEITSDGVLSRVEKKQVRTEWESVARTKIQNLLIAQTFGLASYTEEFEGATVYVGQGYITDYEKKFYHLGSYLNGDAKIADNSTTYASPEQKGDGDNTGKWNGSATPAWLTDFANDQRITPAKYRKYWTEYYEAETILLNAITTLAKMSGDDAQQQIDDISDDKKITPSEKQTLLVQWLAIATELPLLCTQADTYVTNANKVDTSVGTAVSTAKTNYLSAFEALAGALTKGSISYSYNLVSGAVNIPTPNWLTTYIEDTEEFANDNAKNAFIQKWSDYYSARETLQNAITDASWKGGDEAYGMLDEYAADDKLTKFEKISLRREWKNINDEFPTMCQRALQTHVNSAQYVAAYYQLGNYLFKDSPVGNAAVSGRDYSSPTMLQATDGTNGTTTINGATFMSYWAAYYTKRSDLLAACAASKVNYFVGTTVPSAPYYEGDLWLKLPQSYSGQLSPSQAEDGEMMVCINECTTAGQETEQDWANMKVITEKRDPRILLPMLASRAYNFIGASIVSNGYRSVHLTPTQPSGIVDNLWYNGSEVKRYQNSAWNTLSDDTLQMACASLYSLLGTYTIKIFSQTTNTSAKQNYDLCVRKITFTDSQAPSGYQTVEGGLEIMMYYKGVWEILQESTRSIIQNLKGYIRAVVFGSANGDVTSAGFVTTSNLATLFAEMASEEGLVARSELSAYVTKENGYLESGVLVSADNVVLSGNDSISMMVGSVQERIKNPNLVTNSLINETSTEYGFGVRTVELTAGKTYTFTLCGIVPTNISAGMVLKAFVWCHNSNGSGWDSGSWSVTIRNGNNNTGAAQKASVTFTPSKTDTYYITSYLSNESGTASEGDRTRAVTTLWYKIEEGSASTSWVAGNDDRMNLKNYITIPKAINATEKESGCGTLSTSSNHPTDVHFGKVQRIVHSVNGHWQLLFTPRTDKSQLTGKVATFYMIVKCTNSGGFDSYVNGDPVQMCFGDANKVDTVKAKRTGGSDYIDLGNGWRKYYATRKMDSALSDTVGICHTIGEWYVYAVGIVEGGICPSIQEIMQMDGLVSTGINIYDGTIELRANMVKFTNSEGTVSNKIWIDPTTGVLHAVDGVFSGEINATSGKFGNMQISGETFNGVNGKLRFGSYNTAYTTISTSQSELNANANIYLLNELSYCLYATTLASGRAAVIAAGNVAVHAQGRTIQDGGLVKAIKTVTADYTLSSRYDNVVLCNSSAAITLTLPTGCTKGQQFIIRNLTRYRVTINAGSGDTILKVRFDYGYNVTGSIYLPTSESIKTNYIDNNEESASGIVYAHACLLVYDSDNNRWIASYMI